MLKGAPFFSFRFFLRGPLFVWDDEMQKYISLGRIPRSKANGLQKCS